MTFGTAPIGAVVLGGTPGGTVGTVTYTGPSSFTSGPEATFTWSWSHPWLKQQYRFRVTLWNDASRTVLAYDSGWQYTSATSWNFRPADYFNPDFATKWLYIEAETDDGPFSKATDFDQLVFDFVAPTVTITSPTGTAAVQTSKVTVQWTSTQQAEYRVELAKGSLVLHNSGWRVGAITSYEVPVQLEHQADYSATVTIRSVDRVEASASRSFIVDLPSDVQLLPEPNPDVGRLWEIAINGRGFMLYDNRSNEEYRYERTVIPLEAPRMSTGEVFNQSLERYAFAGQYSTADGAGQRYFSRPGSSDRAILDSEGVDLFSTPGQVSLLPDVAVERGGDWTSPNMVTVGPHLYVQVGAGALIRKQYRGEIVSPFSIAGFTGSISSLASDDEHWYAATTDGKIFRGSGPSDPGAAWATLDGVTEISWQAERIVATHLNSGLNRWQVSTVGPSGVVEEVKRTLDAGWVPKGITGGGGFVWWGANQGTSGQVQFWKAGTSGGDTVTGVAAEMPSGEAVKAVHYYLGSVFVRTWREGSDGTTVAIYRGQVAGDGSLSLSLVVRFPVPSQQVVGGGFAAFGSQVFFTWPGVQASGNVPLVGLGVVNVPTGGWSRHLRVGYSAFQSAGGPSAGQWDVNVCPPVHSVVVWQGKLTFSVAGYGVAVEDSVRCQTGWFRTSVWDAGSSLQKSWDQVAVRTLPLGTGQKVSVRVSTDEAVTWRALQGEIVTNGTARAWDLNLPSRSLAVEVQLGYQVGAPRTSSPVVTMTEARYHALGASDVVVTVPILLADSFTMLTGAPAQVSPGWGSAQLQWLESMAQTQVLFQDLGWADTGVAEAMEIVSVRTHAVKVRDARTGRTGLQRVAVVALRRPNI